VYVVTLFFRTGGAYTPTGNILKKRPKQKTKTATKRGAEAQETKKMRAITMSALAIN